MEFKPFNKISRLKRDCVITEKIDGTNAQIFITNFFKDEYIEEVFIDGDGLLEEIYFSEEVKGFIDDYCIAQKNNLYMFAGSRKRWITPENDNYGFARWVKENSDDLFNLGEGQHFGEWWGQGIQRGYDMDKKVFSLFNTGRWINYDTPIGINDKREHCPKCCDVVPILYKGTFNTYDAQYTLNYLSLGGSIASPGFKNPEGIVVYHAASRMLFKQAIKNDESPKSEV